MSDQLKEARAQFFSGPTYKGPTVDVEIDGVLLECRSPKAKHSLRGMAKGNFKIENPDMGEIILDCFFLKETGQQFFDKSHLEELAESSAHNDGILSQLADAIERVSAKVVDLDEAEKN